MKLVQRSGQRGHIKTSGSELQGQEEAPCEHVFSGLCDHYSELFTQMAALNF